jgi:hypothetical protein
MQMFNYFVLNDGRHLNLLPSYHPSSMQTMRRDHSCVYPIYRATKAVCTPDEDDDKEWLQYWMLGGLLFMLTTWVGDSIESGSADTKWLGSLMFLFFWMYFPLTCGALLIYEKITAPLLGPRLKPLQRKMSNIITYVYQVGTIAHTILGLEGNRHSRPLFILSFQPFRLCSTLSISGSYG